MEKFIEESLKAEMSNTDMLVDEKNANCFMIITVILDLLQIEKREYFST